MYTEKEIQRIRTAIAIGVYIIAILLGLGAIFVVHSIYNTHEQQKSYSKRCVEQGGVVIESSILACAKKDAFLEIK